MTWTKIYNKICKLKLFIDFTYWLDVNTDFKPISKIRDCNIKDIWGYLICFAATKNVMFLSDEYEHRKKITKDSEQAMSWCAEKFFELPDEKVQS